MFRYFIFEVFSFPQDFSNSVTIVVSYLNFKRFLELLIKSVRRRRPPEFRINVDKSNVDGRNKYESKDDG